MWAAQDAGLRSGPFRDVGQIIAAVLDQRAALLADPQTDCLRLVHGAADGAPGCVIEKLGPVLIAQLHEGRLATDEAVVGDLCERLMERCGASAVYRKVYPRDRSAGAGTRELDALHRDAQPWLGAPAPAELAVRENGLTFLVRPYDGYSTGLFLEQRDNRARVRAVAAGRRVLNTFSYTCGFSIAAAAGGAAETVSVDVSKRYLEWGKRNFAANALDLAAHRFICSDAREYFGRALRQGRVFDLIILDPPSFARVKQTGRAFSLRDELDALVADALDGLAPRGTLLLSTNQRDLSDRRLLFAVEQAAEAAGRVIRTARREPLPPDFTGDDEFAKSVWVELTAE